MNESVKRYRGHPNGMIRPMTSPDDAATELAALIERAIPLARFLESDECQPEDRARLRDLSKDGYGVFELSNYLNNLCSERARDMARKR